MTKAEAAKAAREARRAAEAAREQEQFERDMDAFYASGGWTKERRARFAPIWESHLRSVAERQAAEEAAQTVEPTAVEAA
ncbi:hypothetical protein MXD62_13130 [Frankia sp. Mgl5]|uniref:hypothetical protein n=1 Tax=Frankia sp. Mgl5 TaxID=2933793 RepID=UPI00200C55CB|nr:hypothetical protein [Frankia sp. Mgl5]MCK9928104.1 hypothetical protein [Frankia sp. Mgl5]